MKSAVLVIGSDDEYPVFGQVANIYVIKQQVIFSVRLLHTLSYHPHYHAFAVERKSDLCFIKYEDLISFVPLHLKNVPHMLTPVIVLKHRLIF